MTPCPTELIFPKPTCKPLYLVPFGQRKCLTCTWCALFNESLCCCLLLSENIGWTHLSCTQSLSNWTTLCEHWLTTVGGDSLPSPPLPSPPLPSPPLPSPPLPSPPLPSPPLPSPPLPSPPLPSPPLPSPPLPTPPFPSLPLPSLSSLLCLTCRCNGMVKVHRFCCTHALSDLEKAEILDSEGGRGDKTAAGLSLYYSRVQN